MSSSTVLNTKRVTILDLGRQTGISPITAELFVGLHALPDDDEEESDCDDEEPNNNTNKNDRPIPYTLKISGFALDAPYSQEFNSRVELVAEKLRQEKVGSNLPRNIVDAMVDELGVLDPKTELFGVNAEIYGLQVESVFAGLEAPKAAITRYENGYIENEASDVEIAGDIHEFINSAKELLAGALDALEDPSHNSDWTAASAAFINLKKREKNREARERKAAKAGKAQNAVEGATKKNAGTQAKQGLAQSGPSQTAIKTPQARQKAHHLQHEKQATPEATERGAELLHDEASSNKEDEDELERQVRQALEEAETDSLFEGDFDLDDEPPRETKEAPTTPEEIMPPIPAQTKSRKRNADRDNTDAETARPAKMAKVAHTSTTLVSVATSEPPSQAPWSLALPSTISTRRATPAVIPDEQAMINERSTTQLPATLSSGDNASKRVAKRSNEKREEVPYNDEIKKACRSGFDDLKKTQITSWCRIHGIAKSGTKDDIERRVEEFITEHGKQLDGFYGTIPGAAELREASQGRDPNAPPRREAQANQPTRADQGTPQPPAQPANAPSSLQTFANTAPTQQVATAQVNPVPFNAQAPHPHASASQPVATPFQQNRMATAAKAPSAEPQMSAVSTNPQDGPTEKPKPVGSVQVKVVQPGLPYPIYQKAGNNDWSFSGDRKHRTPAALEIINQCNRYASQPQLEADLSNYSAAELRNFLRSVACQDVRSASSKKRLQQFTRNWFQVYMKGDAGPIADVELLVDEKKSGDAAEPDAPAEEKAGEVQQQNAVSSSAPVAATMSEAPLGGERARKAKDDQPSRVMLQAHVSQQRLMQGGYARGDVKKLALGSASGFPRGVPMNDKLPIPAAPSLDRTASGRIDSHQHRPQTNKVRRDEQTLSKLQKITEDEVITILDDDEVSQSPLIKEQTPMNKNVIMSDIDENVQQPVTQAQTPMRDAPRPVLNPRPSGDLSMNMPALDRVSGSERITENAQSQKLLSERELAQLQAYARNHPEDLREGAAEDLQIFVDAQNSARQHMQQSLNAPQPGFAAPAGYSLPQGSAVPVALSTPQGSYTPQSPGLPAANLAYQRDTYGQTGSMNAGQFMPPQGYHAARQPEQQQWQQPYAGQHYYQPAQTYHPQQQPVHQQWQQQRYGGQQYQQPGPPYQPPNQGPYNSQYGSHEQYRQ